MIFNKSTFIVYETIHVIFEESITPITFNEPIEKIWDLLDLEIENHGMENVTNIKENLPKKWRYASSHPYEQIHRNPLVGVKNKKLS